MSTADGQAATPFLPGMLQDSPTADQAHGRDAGLHRPARLGSSPFMQEILEDGTFPADEQPQNLAAPVTCHSTSGLQPGFALGQERSPSIDIPSRSGSSPAPGAGSDFRPASAGDVSHSSQRLSRRSSSGLLQGSPDVRPASAEDRFYSSSTSSAGDGSKKYLQPSTDFRPASAGDRHYGSVSPARHGGLGFSQAGLDNGPAVGEDRFHAININGSPPSDTDQPLVSRSNPARTDGHAMGSHPMHSSFTQLEQDEMGDRQGLLTSLKSHRVESFRHRENAAGLSRRLQQALQACEGARRLYWENGGLVMLTSAMIMSCGALAVALIDDRVPVFEIVLIRSLASLLLSLAVAQAQGVERWFGSPKLWPFLAARGFIGAASMTLYYEGIARMPLADAMTIMYSNPVLCAILGWALRGERVGILGSLGIVVTLLGVVFVAQPPVIFGGHEWSHTRMAGTIMAFFAAVTCALAFFVIGYIPKSEPSLVVAIWFHGASLASSVPFLAAGYPDVAVLPGRFDWAMLGTVIMTSFLGQVLLNRAFQISNASKASSINCVQVLSAHVFGVTLLQERESIFGLAGSAAIAAGVVTVNSAKIAKAESASPAGDIRGGGLLQYSPVITSPYAADASEASPDAKTLPRRSSWRDWSALATRQLADMQTRRSSDNIQAREEAQPLHVPELAGQLAEDSSAQQAGRNHVAEEHLGSLQVPNPGKLGSVREARPGSWTAGGLSMLSPRLHRTSIELQGVSQASGVLRKGSGQVSESPTANFREPGSRRVAGVRTDRRSMDRTQNLRDREPSFGDWHFQRVPGNG